VATLSSELEKKVTERINEVVEEETSRKLSELNVITEVSEVGEGTIKVKFCPLSPYSPVAVDTGRGIRNATLSVEGVKRVTVECSGHMMDELVNRLVNGQQSQLK
jgi:metal-sulfur cluster biosynthetic enzyme